MTSAEPAAASTPPVEPAAPEVVTAEVAVTTTAEVAVADQWDHEWIDFNGDRLSVRRPTQQALAAYSLAMSHFVPAQTRNDITGLFIARHLSPSSYERVFSRLMDPDDTEYTVSSIGEMMKAIVELSIEVKAEAAG